MIDDSFKVLITLLELIHHAFILIGSGADGIGVALAALVKVVHLVLLLCVIGNDILRDEIYIFG
jgi:hypothetical protein